MLEMGCGNGRLTRQIATHAASVLAFDRDAEAVRACDRLVAAELADRVAYAVASGKEIELEPASFDLAVFSWSVECRRRTS